MLDQGGTITLDYDGNQRCIRKTTPEQQTVYLGDLYECVTDLLTGAVEHRYYVHGAERAVALVRPEAAPAERTLYVHVAHLGSVEALTNEAGTVVERRSYDAFGARRDPAWGSAAVGREYQVGRRRPSSTLPRGPRFVLESRPA